MTDLIVTKVWVKGKRVVSYEAKSACNVYEVTKDMILRENARENKQFNYANVSVSKSGRLSVPDDIPREDYDTYNNRDLIKYLVDVISRDEKKFLSMSKKRREEFLFDMQFLR